MINSWEEMLFLFLMTMSLGVALVVRDWRLRAGVFTLIAAWAFSMVLAYFWPSPPLYTYVITNFAVFYIFLQLHFWQEGETAGPIWPVSIMLLEIFIFLSHITKLTLGNIHYIIVIDILFAIELFIVVAVGFLKMFQGARAKKSSSTG